MVLKASYTLSASFCCASYSVSSDLPGVSQVLRPKTTGSPETMGFVGSLCFYVLLGVCPKDMDPM